MRPIENCSTNETTGHTAFQERTNAFSGQRSLTPILDNHSESARAQTPIPSIHPAGDGQLVTTLDRLWAELARLRQLELGDEIASNLADRVSALRYLLHHGANRPILAGLVGGASCGKSTLFGSLIGRPVSRIHYQPHSSLGPIVWLHRRHRSILANDSQPSRFFPQLTVKEVAPAAASTVGAVSELTVVMHGDDAWSGVALMDLPDISSESSRREGWLVRHLLPWMDLVVWMVDPNDYLFEDLYIDLIEETSTLGQHSIVVVNDIHGQLQHSSPVLQDRIARFRADAAFILPRLSCNPNDPYPLFRQEPDFVRLRQHLINYRGDRPTLPLIARVRHDARCAVHANMEWSRLVGELSTALERIVARHRNRILASAPLLSVLPESAREELDRIRNRFSLWHHGKRLFRAIRYPAQTIGQAAFRKFEMSADDLDTTPLYRYLVGALKEFGVDLHRGYLESRFVQQMQQRESKYAVLGSFEPETLNFKDQLDTVARHIFVAAQQMLADPAVLKDKRFHFVLGTTGIALVFLVAESMLGMVGMTLLVGKGLTALAAVLSPELARYLPLDRMSRLAVETRDMLGTVIDKQMRQMVEFYTAPHGRFLEPGDRLLTLLQSLQQDSK